MSSTSTDTATRRQHGLLLHYLHMALVKCIQLMFCIDCPITDNQHLEYYAMQC